MVSHQKLSAPCLANRARFVSFSSDFCCCIFTRASLASFTSTVASPQSLKTQLLKSILARHAGTLIHLG